MAGLVEGSKVFFRRNGSTILTFVGAAGVVATGVAAAKDSTKASLLLAEAKEEKGDELTWQEKVLTIAPAYIPTFVVGLATVTCIFGANILNKKHQESLASAYILLNEKFKEYRSKVIDIYGEEANDQVEASIYNDNENKEDNELLLFYDEYSQRYFKSTMFKVQQAEYFLNREFIMKDYAYLNEWYELLEIGTVEEGWDYGWSVAFCMDCYWQPWLDFGHIWVKTDDGQDCCHISIFGEPVDNFEDYC